jgi:hypothetical protein
MMIQAKGNATITRPKYGGISVFVDSVSTQSGPFKQEGVTIRVHTHDNSTIDFLNSWLHEIYNIHDGSCGDYKATMMWREPTIIFMCFGVWPCDLNTSFYDAAYGDAVIKCECNLRGDIVKSYGPDDICNFDVVFEYVKHFAERVHGTVGVLGSPMFRVVAGPSVADFELSGHIVCGNNKSHIADPEWENKVARWLGVAPQRLSR